MTTRKKHLTITRPKSSAPRANTQFATTFARLKKILLPYAKHFTVSENTPQRYTLLGEGKSKNPKRFGAVAIRQTHVTFYSCPAILSQGSRALKKQMNGSTASVNLPGPNDALIDELATLTAIRFHDYQSSGYL